MLKHANYGEADRMLTVLTPFKGKIKIVARGVRRITSRRAGNVEPLNRVRLQLFQAQGAPILTEAESIQTYSKVKGELTLSAYASHIVEVIDRLIPENQTNPQVYQLLAAILELLEKNPRQIFIRAFEVKLLAILGFWSLDQISTNVRSKPILERLHQGSWTEIAKFQISQAEALDLERILRYYLEKILEAPLKSVKLIQRLKKTSGGV